ncbi:hypothetical protein HJC23_006297 [Cyclotella cryptica]|uniref:N-acetyltransferase domain-containing protein n=1 Tax=Cyclotella cryptica TaxID=29204 RepID=A0ABD3PCA5_9STRA|eukprot:CCRYP_015780-RA/>CCRYP_015780-RA protein AED:0.18 eAED:0.18 QI:0/-1/0/1/-1/1/1/0/268
MERQFFHFLLLNVVIGCSVEALNALPKCVRIRSGRPDDELRIAFTMAKELMNPLGISHENNLLVACDVNNSRELIGWAQIRSIGYAGYSTDPDRFEDGDVSLKSTGRRAGPSKLSMEREVDDLMWEEFEEDPTPFPNGFASLPWSKEYSAASKAADDRLARRKELLQVELDNTPKLWELSSVYVVPSWRRRGIGSELVRQVLNRHVANNQIGRDIYALTLAKNLNWYEQFGFKCEEKVPEAMAFEMTAGNAITKLIGEQLVCIRTRLR